MRYSLQQRAPVVAVYDGLDLSPGRRGVVAWAALLFLAGWAAAAGEFAAMPLRSADGRFAVTSGPSNAAVRPEVLQFAQEVSRTLTQLTGWPLTPGERPILLALDAGEDAATVSHGLFHARGRVWGQLNVPTAPLPDAAQLSGELVAVLARLALYREVTPGTVATEFAPWFLAGLANVAARRNRQSDTEAVLARWSRGRLPPIWELCASNGCAEASDLAVASHVVAWCLDQPGAKRACAAWMSHLAQGRPWDAALFLHTFAAQDDPLAADEQWDLWLVRRGHMVFEPGTTPPGVVRRFRAQLLIYPGDCGMPLGSLPTESLTLAALLAHRDAPWADAVARSKAAAIRNYAVGRDREFQALAEQYAATLDGLRRGVATDELCRWLEGAEQRRRLFESEAAAGLTRSGQVASRASAGVVPSAGAR